MVPLEQAYKTERLAALDPKRARRDDLAKKFKAVVSGRPLPRRRPEVNANQSKYTGTSSDED